MKLVVCLTNIILFYDHIRLTQGELLESNFLIVADSIRRNLFQVGLDDGIVVPILPSSLVVLYAVAYDPFTGFVYWTDAHQRTIGRYSLTAASKTMSIVKQFDATTELDGLAIDTAQQNLYYCARGDVGKVGVIKTDGQQHRDLIQQAGMKPRAIVLDLNNRMMYWSDWGDRPSINRANMDTGEDRVVLVSGELLEWPNALAIDFDSRTMFWGDAKIGHIMSSNLDGNEKKLLYINPGDRYYGIAVTPRFLYITDWTERAVRKLDRMTNAISNQPPAVFGIPAGIIYVAHVRFNGTPSTGFSFATATLSRRIRLVTTTTPMSTSFPSTTSSSNSTTTLASATTAPTPKVVQSSTYVPGGLSETTLTVIVCAVVAGIVLISLFCSLAICAAKKRSRSSSVNAETVNPGQQLALSYTVPTAFRDNQTEQTTIYDRCGSPDGYDYIQDSNLYYLEPRTSNSSDGYMQPLYAFEQRRQKSPSEPEGRYDKIPKLSFI